MLQMLQTLTFSKLILLFTAYSFLGWVCETIWCSVGERKLVNRGFLSGPWCPVYGFGALIILLFVLPLSKYPLVVFVLAVISTSVLEYFTGWLLETLFRTKWWDYSEKRFNIKGRVCLLNSTMFGLLGLLLVYIINPAVEAGIGKVPIDGQRLLASTLFVLFFFDLLKSLSAASKLAERMSGIRDSIEEMKSISEIYDWDSSESVHDNFLEFRRACEAHPENKVASGIAHSLGRHLDGGRPVERLMHAFPTMMPRDFSSEFAAIKENLERRIAEEKERSATFFNKTKLRLKAERENFAAAYKDISLIRMIWVFLIACVIGYVVETLFCLAKNGTFESRQGLIYGPFSQIYGFGAVILVLLLAPFARRSNTWLFFGGAVVGGLFEALCSLIQEAMFGSVSWEYSSHALSLLGGRTSLIYMFFWGILSVFYMNMIYPRMSALIDRIPVRPKRFFTNVIVFFFAADMLISAMAVGRWSERQLSMPPENNVAAWLDERYPDDMLAEIYPNMVFTHEAEQAE